MLTTLKNKRKVLEFRQIDSGNSLHKLNSNANLNTTRLTETKALWT